MKVNLSGLSIYYEVQGKGEPVILLHGWGTDSGSLRGVSTLLKEKFDARTYCIDMPGFGFSDPPPEPWGVDNYVEIVMQFLEQAGVEKTSLIGHSFGGRIAIKIAANYPERVDKLVLVDSAGIRPKRGGSYYVRVAAARVVGYFFRLLPGLKKTVLHRRIYSVLGSTDYQNANGVMRGTFVRVVNEDLQHYLPQIDKKTAIIWGEYDRATPVSDAHVMHKMIAGSVLHILPNAGHYSFLDNFTDFSTALLDFWRQPCR